MIDGIRWIMIRVWIHWNECNLLHLITASTFFLTSEYAPFGGGGCISFEMNWSISISLLLHFRLMFNLWGKHGGKASGFLHRSQNIICNSDLNIFRLALAWALLGWLAAQNPVLNISSSHYLTTSTCFRLCVRERKGEFVLVLLLNITFSVAIYIYHLIY